MDRRKAKVDLIATPSESLLSEGRLEPIEEAVVVPRGKAEGQSVWRPSRDDSET